MSSGRAWLVLSYGDERGYAGNTGYADELDLVYRYDSFVQNHLQVAEGDLLIICNRERVLGVASVSKLVSKSGTKTRRRCPQCGKSVATERKELRPRFKCSEGHTFDEAVINEEPCTLYSAWFHGAFREVPQERAVPIGQVRDACVNFNRQMAMQEVRLSDLKAAAEGLLPLIHALAAASPHIQLVAADALDEEDAYVPISSDERERVERQIRARRGQTAFRKQLRERFKDTCVVTGCKLPDLLEAAHILPYRGRKDHHPANGLLLRADVHTLFDLDLLGIEPDTLKVHLHRRAQGAGYDDWEGRPLTCDAHLLSSDALQARWQKFLSRG